MEDGKCTSRKRREWRRNDDGREDEWGGSPRASEAGEGGHGRRRRRDGAKSATTSTTRTYSRTSLHTSYDMLFYARLRLFCFSLRHPTVRRSLSPLLSLADLPSAGSTPAPSTPSHYAVYLFRLPLPSPRSVSSVHSSLFFISFLAVPTTPVRAVP